MHKIQLKFKPCGHVVLAEIRCLGLGSRSLWAAFFSLVPTLCVRTHMAALRAATKREPYLIRMTFLLALKSSFPDRSLTTILMKYIPLARAPASHVLW